MTTRFNSVPQRRAVSHNPLWAKNILAEKGRRSPAAKMLADNRAKIARLEELVRRGKLKPREVPMGQLTL